MKYAELVALVKQHMGWADNKVVLWFNTPNTLLGNCSPISLIARGRGHKVEKFIKAAISEAKPK